MLLAPRGQRPGALLLSPAGPARPPPQVSGPVLRPRGVFEQGPDGCFATRKQWGEATFATPSTAELLRAGDLGSEPALPMAWRANSRSRGRMAACLLEPFTRTASESRPLPGMTVPGNQPATLLPSASRPYSRHSSV